MTKLLVAWFLFASLLWSTPARAALVTATYCVDWTVAFDDEDTGDFLTGTTTDAYGVVLRFSWTANGGGSSDLTLDWSGSTPGCKTTLVENSSAPFTVSVLRRAVVNNNTIEVRNSSGALLSSTWLTGHTPSNNGSYSHTVGQSALQSENIMAAAGFALKRRNGGVTGETLTFVRDVCPGTSTSCFDWPDEIYIIDNHVDHKFVIAHELGHALSFLTVGSGSINVDTTANRDCGLGLPCCTPAYGDSGHKVNSKEFQSAAVVEGLAHFYAAAVFNDETQTSCQFQTHYVPDWDANGFLNDPADVSAFDCESAPVSGEALADYFGDRCEHWYIQNRATEFDYLRLFWDLHTDESITVADLFDVFAAANPNTWNANGNGTGGSYPAQRMSDAAFDVGGTTLQDTYDDWAVINGTDR